MQETVNIHETNERSVTGVLPEPSRRDRSRFGLTGLRSLRDKHGPLSAIGHRVSNIEEMFDNLPPGPEDRIEYLTSDSEKAQYENLMKSIGKQTAELAALTRAA